MLIEDTRKFTDERIEKFTGLYYVDYPWSIKTFNVSYEMDNSGVDGVHLLKEWVKDNLGYDPLSTYGYFYFKTEADAIAFKLRWG